MRRLLFLALLGVLAAFALYRWLRLDHGLAGGRRGDQYTPAEGPRIDPKDVQVLAALDAEYTRLVQAVIPSVVSITTSRHLQAQTPGLMDPLEFMLRNRRVPGPQDQVKTSLGSGVIVSREGHVITNHHVIAGMEKIEVQLTDGRILPAQLIGTDEQTDIAIVKIATDKIEPLSLGDSDAVRVGEMVFAIGNPFGLQETVTQGIISAKGRRAMRDSGIEFLQTDAAVNQGNSGGPLINLKGEIIGINSAIAASQQGAWIGISFAVPSNVARRVLESVLKTGHIVRGYLGVNMVDITPELAQAMGLHNTEGVIVQLVLPGSPAEKAGLESGDIIRAFNGRPVHDKFFLRTCVAEVDVGATVQLTIVRNGQQHILTAQIVEAPRDFVSKPQPVAP